MFLQSQNADAYCNGKLSFSKALYAEQRNALSI